MSKSDVCGSSWREHPDGSYDNDNPPCGLRPGHAGKHAGPPGPSPHLRVGASCAECGGTGILEETEYTSVGPCDCRREEEP